MSLEIITDKLIQSIKDKINEDKYSSIISNDIIKPIVKKIIIELYPYIIICSCIVIFIIISILIIIFLNLKMYLKN